jgi:hypothetical protein
MRQAVRVGRQILLPRIRSQGKTGIQNVAAVSSTNVWAVGGQRLCTLPFQTLRYIGMAAHGVLSSLPFSPITVDKGPSAAAMVVELPGLRTGEIALPRELGALDGPVPSDVSFERQL